MELETIIDGILVISLLSSLGLLSLVKSRTTTSQDIGLERYRNHRTIVDTYDKVVKHMLTINY